MREIKFRAWLLKENKMVDVDTISKNKGYGGALEIFIDNPSFDPLKKGWEGNNIPHWSYINHSMEVHKERNNGDDFILLQFTSLKDKNGKEIYEGDIIENGDYIEDAHEYNTWIRVVEWDEQDACFRGIDGERIKIIGNIFENPELK